MVVEVVSGMTMMMAVESTSSSSILSSYRVQTLIELFDLADFIVAHFLCYTSVVTSYMIC